MKPRAYITLCVLLGGATLFVNLRGIDWLPGRSIQIGYRMLPAPTAGAVDPVVFLLNRQSRLTAVRVFRESEIRTNKYALALWELVAPKGSGPVTYLSYGAPVAGMTNRYAGVGAEKLAPDTEYRIVLEAGKLRGQREFTFRPLPAGR